jgi:hypothetical protein
MSTDFSAKPAGAPAVQPANEAIAADRAVTIVYQVVDNRTSLAPQQLPDQAALRRRAYFRALNLAGRAPPRLLVTDRIA